MLQPLMALLAAVGLGAGGDSAGQPRCGVETAEARVHEECAEWTRLREEREGLRQRLSELRRAGAEAATGGAGEAGQSGEAPSPVAVERPAEEGAVAEEVRALRREVEALRREVREAEVQLAAVKPAEGPVEVVRAPEPEHEQGLELLRNADVLTVQNASPVEKAVLGEVSVANRTQEGEAGFVLQPRVRVGTPWNVEFGASAQVRNLAGEQQGTTGAVGAYAMGQVLEERRAVPQLSLRGEVMSPQGDEGVSAEARLLATKRFGETRLHGNVGYSARQDAADDYLVGLAADHPIGERLLLQGDAYYVNPLGDEAASVNASVGSGLRVGSSFVVTGAVGVNATATDVAPRLLFGVLGRI